MEKTAPIPEAMMKAYLIVYAAHKDEAALMAAAPFANSPLPPWHGLPGVWLLQSPLSAVALRNALSPFFAETEHLLVVEVGATAAWNTETEADSQRILDILTTLPRSTHG